ncbi:substrate-binding domain-containing protein [Rhodococcus rhodochrous]|uniref:LysR substrate-binding domain-containing protein n=1 Tax=Rhodococcus rhodochrous TaxID=1829 RepID=UPI001E4D1011|nr:LysR substrate-binding domain-containing protein [Rhodococcus rhodochrous]MCB8913391.1 substrate-binding domain-containing protein [Rhodococcus rhodochrous]
MVYEEITRNFRALHDKHEVVVGVQDLPLGSPFSAVLNGEVDAAIAEMPVHESELIVGFRFPAQDQLLAVGLDHPSAHRTVIDVEELAEVDLLHRIGDAPAYWKTARTPATTPSGAPITSSAGFTSLEQGLTLAATGDCAGLVCRPVAERSLRGDLH